MKKTIAFIALAGFLTAGVAVAQQKKSATPQKREIKPIDKKKIKAVPSKSEVKKVSTAQPTTK